MSRYLGALPAELTKVLRGAGRAGASVIADDAKSRSRSDLVSNQITAKVRVDADEVRATVTVKPGFARSIAIWLEYGTSPHFITVDDSVRQGMTAGRINRAGSDAMKGTLMINGEPVGETVYHPGARPYPFLRPALDAQRSDAIAAAQAYILARVSRGAVVAGPAVAEDDE